MTNPGTVKPAHHLDADVTFTATNPQMRSSTITITMHVRLADDYPPPRNMYNAMVGIVTRDLRFVASATDTRMMNADLRAAGWVVSQDGPFNGWTDEGVAVVTPLPAP